MYFHFHYLVFPTFSPFFFCSKALKCGTKAQTVSHFPFSLLLFSAGLDIVYLLNRSTSTFTFHCHFHFPFSNLLFSVCLQTEPANAEQKCEYFHFSLTLSLSHFPFSNLLFSVCLHTEPANAEQKREYNRRGVAHWVRCWKRRGDLACFWSFHTYILS